MQNFGFAQASTALAIQNANNKKLIEASERITYEETEGTPVETIEIENFRLTTIGAYHLKRWISEFSYLDAMTHDTPILDVEIRNELMENVNSLSIVDRYNRAIAFRRYLSKVWHDSNLKPSYFDWNEVIHIGEETFERVRKALPL